MEKDMIDYYSDEHGHIQVFYDFEEEYNEVTNRMDMTFKVFEARNEAEEAIELSKADVDEVEALLYDAHGDYYDEADYD